MSFLLMLLAVLAVTVTQMLAGGRQMALCLPGYGLLAVAAVLSWWPRRRTPIPRAATECLVAAILFCTYVSVRAVLSPEAFLARTDLYAAVGALALYLLVALNVTASRLRLLLIGGLLVLALADCAIGAVQFFKGQEFMPFPFLPRPGYGSRASGFYGYPNHLSGFLEMVLMMGLSIALWSRWPTWAKMLLGYACVMFVLCIVATGSRGGYISTVIGLMAFLLLSLVLVGKLASGRVIGIFLLGLLLVGGVGWGVRKAMSKNFFLESRAESTLSVDVSRMRLWQAAWKQFRLQPVVGTGSGTYLYYGRQFRSPSLSADPVHAHNDYFEMLGEYGILGIITAVIFLETHLRRGWNSFTGRIRDGGGFQGMGSNSLALTIGAMSAASACLAHSMLDFNLHMPANLLTAAVIFGLLATPGEGPDAVISEEEEDPGWPPFVRLALPALGILIVVRIAPTAPAEYYAERCRAILADWHRVVSADLDVRMADLARRGLAWDPKNPELHFSLAEAQSAQGDLTTDPAAKETFYTQSIESYRKALECAPGDVRFVLALVSALDGLQRFSESEPLLARALQMDHNGHGPHIAMASHLFLQGKYPEAAAEYQTSIRLGAWATGQAGLERIQEAVKGKGGGETAPAGKPGSN
jgi:O-antigen ligase